MSCKHHVGGECRHSLALPLYGARPSAGVCGVCEHYEGPARGVGDIVANVARLTGVKAVVKAVAGESCGCNSRKQFLNEKFPLRNT